MNTEKQQIVLVVDDSIVICKQIELALQGEAVELYEAHDGKGALEMVERYQPDLILLDVVLPDTNGYDLFDSLKGVGQENAVIIFLTSRDGENDVIQGFAKGACDYIKKPFAKEELRVRVNIHLKIKAQKDELNRKNKELADNMEKLNYIALRDGLTGLYNRRYVIGDLVDEIRKNSMGNERNTVLIMADIDDFKKVNDTYGHEAGDMALKAVSGVLTEVCKDHRVVRWGGEEFLIILLNVSKEEAFDISERIRKTIEELPMIYKGRKFRCTLTLGMHVYQFGQGMEENANCADRALYKGKQSGKNCSVWYENEIFIMPERQL